MQERLNQNNFTRRALLSCLKYRIFLLLLISSRYASAEMPCHFALPALSSWQLELGTRYGFSRGKYVYNQYFNDTLQSRLTYERLNGHSAEGFWWLKHQCGLFWKGYLGGGSLDSGRFVDEDFPPFIVPYSKTVSKQRDGWLGYVSADVGYKFLQCKKLGLGGFIGYSYWTEHYNSFGVQQLATFPTPFVPSQVNQLDNIAKFNSLRLGIHASLGVTKKMCFTADAAYLRSYLNNYDFHNLRPDIRGLFEDGTGNGFQIDTLVNWSLCPSIQLGIGGRWWHEHTIGFTHFEETFLFATLPSVNDVTLDRYGLIVQAQYQFNHFYSPSCEGAFCWPGFYLGANIGCGMSSNTFVMIPKSAAAQILQSNLQIIPSVLHVRNLGFLGGGHIGYNWQIGKAITGVEGEFDKSSLNGSKGVSVDVTAQGGIADNLSTSATTEIKWITTIKGRLGTLVTNNLLVYLTAGAAFGGVRLDFNQHTLVTSCAQLACANRTRMSTQMGWAAGSGFEYALNKSFTLRTEYLYVDLGKTVAIASGDSFLGPNTFKLHSPVNSHTIQMGLYYKL